jgi:hypothetical protein
MRRHDLALVFGQFQVERAIGREGVPQTLEERERLRGHAMFPGASEQMQAVAGEHILAALRQTYLYPQAAGLFDFAARALMQAFEHGVRIGTKLDKPVRVQVCCGQIIAPSQRLVLTSTISYNELVAQQNTCIQAGSSRFSKDNNSSVP